MREPELDQQAIFALDNVRLDLPVAGAASRSLAVFVDYMLLSFLAVSWIFGSTLGLSNLGLGGLGDGWLAAIVILGLFVLDWGYFAGGEMLFDGRTPGKMAVGLRVVSRNGGQVGRAAILVRNLVRVVDLFIGVPLMVIDPLARRLGDRLAGTLVLRDRRSSKELVLKRVPEGWGAREIAFLEALLERLDELEPERARALAGRVVSWVRGSDPTFFGTVDDADPVRTLKRAFVSE